MRATKTVGLLMMALSVLVAPAVLAEHLVGTVVDISDGDTVRIRADGIHKIRLKGIDAPEMSQPFGPESRQHLVELTFMKRVAAECPERDHYGRLICTLYATDPECNDPWCALEYDVNLAQLEASQAWWYRKFAHEQTEEQRRRYESAERLAQARRVGLWSEPGAMPPWEWRRR
jgi:endonuclease YncB( thermonuclease family)